MKDEELINSIKETIKNIHNTKNINQKKIHVKTLLSLLNVPSFILQNSNEDIISNELVNLISSFEKPIIITDDNTIIICSDQKILKLVSDNGNIVIQNILEKTSTHYILERIELHTNDKIEYLQTTYSIIKNNNKYNSRGIIKKSVFDLNGVELSYRTVFTERQKDINKLDNKIIQEELKNDKISLKEGLLDLEEYDYVIGEELLKRINIDKIEYNFQSKDNKKHGFILPIERNIYRCKDLTDKIYDEFEYNTEKEKLILNGEYKQVINNIDDEKLKEQFSCCLQR